MLISVETHITCDFPGGGGFEPSIPPLDQHMLNLLYFVYVSKEGCKTTLLVDAIISKVPHIGLYILHYILVKYCSSKISASNIQFVRCRKKENES